MTVDEQELQGLANWMMTVRAGEPVRQADVDRLIRTIELLVRKVRNQERRIEELKDQNRRLLTLIRPTPFEPDDN